MGRYVKKEDYIAKYGEEAWNEYSSARYAKAQEWRAKNKEHIVEYNKMNHARYYKNNKEKVLEASKERYLRDKDKISVHAKEYYQKNRETILQQKRAHYEENKETCLAKQKEYRDRNVEKIKARNKEYYERNKDVIRVKQKEYSVKNKEKIAEYHREFYKNYKPSDEQKEYWKKLKNDRRYNTKEGRAQCLADNYKRHDRDNNLDPSSNVDSEWIMNNIFSGQKCIYCGDSDWQHLGCDRIDNEKPHTPDNCVCACGICNTERSCWYSVDEFKHYRLYNPRFIDLQERKRKAFNPSRI